MTGVVGMRERLLEAAMAPWSSVLVLGFLVAVVWLVLGVDPSRPLFWVLTVPRAVPIVAGDLFWLVRRLRGVDVVAERRTLSAAVAAEMRKREKERS